MGFKLGDLPTKGAGISELADFLEIQCLLSGDGYYSITSAKSALGIPDDETRIDGIESEEDQILSDFSDALQEIEDRNMRCDSKYPFIAERYTIKIKPDIKEDISLIYYYLLLATRENMGIKRIHKDLDGALLFEHFCSHVIKEYFGYNAKSMVFGTGSAEFFNSKIDSLLTSLEEGGSSKVPEGSLGMQKDGKLDVIVWIPFADKRKGKLIGLGQCKTGTNWEPYITQLRSRAFFNCYTTYSPFVDPINLFFVADSLCSKWEENVRYSESIFFDRCRLMNYLPKLPADLFNQIKLWSESVISTYKN